MKKAMSLRSTLATSTILVTVLALFVSGALVSLTTILHRTTVSSSSAVESVWFAEEAEIDLLLHDRARDAIVRRAIEDDLRRKLLEARRFVTTEDEARVLAEAETKVESYIAASRDPQRGLAERAAQHEAAYGALEALITINVDQSKTAQQDASLWDRRANILGVGVGASLVAVAGALLIWLRVRAFEPIFGLAAAMDRFGRGDHEARAGERGVRELRDICARFNEMASSIAAQRQAQIAFLGGVAHDLRSPLSTLQMSVALLSADATFPSNDKFHRAIDRIGRQITRMERMLGDFLDVSRIEAGQLDLQLETHDARRLVEEVIDLFEQTTQEHRLDVRLADHVVSVRCDHLRIEQVITNLLSNAIKYSPAGSTIEVVLESRGAELELSIIDQGVGISEKDRCRMFEPFQRVGLSQEVVPGVGLGLFVVRKIVEAHHGRIEVESTPGRGSTFRVFLPVRCDSFEEPPRPRDEASRLQEPK